MNSNTLMQKDEACELPHLCWNTLILVLKDIFDFTDKFVDLQLRYASIPFKKCQLDLFSSCYRKGKN